MQRPVFLSLLSIVFVLAACAQPGIAPGDAQRGFVVWGFVGHSTTTAAPGQTVTLVDAAGRTVQTTTSDGTGKYVLAYHPAGNYQLRVANVTMPVAITTADQRLDVDLSSASGEMNYAAGAAKEMLPPSCPPPAAAPTSTATNGTNEQRDPNLVGTWERQDSISSGDAFMSTKLSLLICEDGSFVHTVGDAVGGGGDWHGESKGDGSSTRGRWRTENSIVYTAESTDFQPYARYYLEAGKLMFTFENGKREVWYRR